MLEERLENTTYFALLDLFSPILSLQLSWQAMPLSFTGSRISVHRP